MNIAAELHCAGLKEGVRMHMVDGCSSGRGFCMRD